MQKKTSPTVHVLVVLVFSLSAAMVLRAVALSMPAKSRRVPVPMEIVSAPVKTTSVSNQEKFPKTPQSIFKNADYLARILMLSGKGSDIDDGNTGAGFIVNFNNKYLILTALHTVTPSSGKVQDVWAMFKNDPDKPCRTKVDKTNPALDLAALIITEPDFKFAGQLAMINMENDLEVGDEVYSLGSPLHTDYSFGKGNIMNLTFGKKRDPLFKLDTTIMHSAPIAPGNSGGPLVDRYGRVIGMNICVDKESQQFGYASFMSDILKWLATQY